MYNTFGCYPIISALQLSGCWKTKYRLIWLIAVLYNKPVFSYVFVVIITDRKTDNTNLLYGTTTKQPVDHHRCTGSQRYSTWSCYQFTTNFMVWRNVKYVLF